jgi:glycosyltransferase involved in cell wall biosynthesis
VLSTGDGASGAAWAPSPVLEPSWLHAHATTYDVVHVHFGFEHRSAAQLAAFVAALRHLGTPLVLTVHDLVNPHLRDQAAQRAALDVLVPAADALVTLTEGAAAVLAATWGRTATVLPHPHVVPLERLAVARPARGTLLVGLHDKPRANVDAEPVRAELAGWARASGAEVVPHPGWLPEPALWDHLESLDALVLPYRFGTHSGLVEACHDLGTPVVATDVGFLAEQQALATFELDIPGSLTAALQRALGRGRPGPVAGARAVERDRLTAAHEQLYRSLVDERRAA